MEMQAEAERKRRAQVLESEGTKVSFIFQPVDVTMEDSSDPDRIFSKVT